MEKNTEIEVKITADTTELEKAIDRCTTKIKELIQLSVQADKLLNGNVRD